MFTEDTIDNSNLNRMKSNSNLNFYIFFIFLKYAAFFIREEWMWMILLVKHVPVIQQMKLKGHANQKECIKKSVLKYNRNK